MKKLQQLDIINIIFFCAILVLDLLYMNISTKTVSEYITKGAATGAFVVCGIVNLIYTLKNKKNYSYRPTFKYFMMLGLFFAALGDIFLIDIFVLGVAFFALGHVFYLIAFFSIIKPNCLDAIVGAIIFIPALLLILLYKKFDFNGMKVLIIIYALILSTMTAKTISNLIRDPNKKNILLVLGAALFFLSDLMLLFRLFASAPVLMSHLCVIFYYPAQFVLAWAISYVSKTETISQGE